MTPIHSAIVDDALPEGPREPIRDAPEPCPACGAVAWVKIGAVVACERCGHVVGTVFHVEHEHGSQTSYHFGPVTPEAGSGGEEVDAEPFEFEAEAFEFDVEAFERGRADALAAVSFPVYAVPGRARSANARDALGTVVVDHDVRDESGRRGGRELYVVSGPRGVDADDPRDELLWMLDEEPDDSRSPAARLIASAQFQRDAQRLVAGAEPVERALLIDGRSEPFTVLAARDAWVATREHGDAYVRVCAEGFPLQEITLEPLADVANPRAGTIADVTREAERARREAAGELLKRAEVAALIDEHGLSAHRDAVLAAIRPGYWLLDGDHPRTRIGGQPDLAPGETWPHDEDGIPLTFVAQIDCATLPPVVTEFPLPEWDHGGALLRLFAPLDGRMPEPAPAVALVCPPGTPVAPAALPPRPDPMPDTAWEPDDDSLRELGVTRVRPVPFLSAQNAWHAGIRDEADAYFEFARWLAAGGVKPPNTQWQLPHLLGHGSTLQGEDPGSAGAFVHPDVPRGAWRTLLNVPLERTVGIGLAIVIPAEDLASGAYHRLVVEVSMD